MTELIHGQLLNVERVAFGDELVADAPEASTSLTVDDTAAFEATGGTLILNDVILVYTSVDHEAETITLAEPLPAAAVAVVGDSVETWDTTSGTTYGEYVAHVNDDAAGDTAPPVEAVVDHRMIESRYLTEGVPPGDVFVTCELDDEGEIRLLSVDGREPFNSAEFLDPETMPPATPPSSDELPPPPVTEVTATGGKGFISVRWPGTVNPDGFPVRYELHVSEADFVPVFGDVTTRLIDTNANIVPTADRLADGTLFDYFVADPVSGLPTEDPKLYWFSVIAYDTDGPAAPSPAVAASMNQTATVDLAVRSITGDLLAGSVVLGSLVVTPAAEGARIQLGVAADTPPSLQAFDAAEGITAQLTTDGSPHFLKGEANLDAATVAKLALQGTEHVLLPGSRVTLRGTTLAPTGQPSASGDSWPIQTLDVDDFNADKRGLFWNAADSTWFFTVQGFGSNPISSVRQVDVNGAGVAGWNLGGLVEGYISKGLWKVGSTWYVLMENADENDWHFKWYIMAFNTSFAFIGNKWLRPTFEPMRDPAFGYNYAEDRLLMAYATSAGNWRVDEYNRTLGVTGGPATTQVVTGGPGVVPLASILYGTFDFPTGDQYVIVPANPNGGSPDIRVFNLSLTEHTNRKWPIANNAHLAGVDWDGQNFHHLSINSNLGHILEYTKNAWTSESADWWSCYTLWDGTHESGPSAKRKITMTKRGRLTVTGLIPAGSSATRIRWYIGRGSTAPLDSAMFRQADPAVGVVTSKYDAVAFNDALGDLADARTPFPAGAASDYVDEAGQTLLKSDGTTATFTVGDLKPVTYDVAGAGAVIDNGWVLLDGTDVSTSAPYDRLWNKWGNPAPSGAAGTFRLPNAKGRMPIGAGAFLAVRGTTGPADGDPTHTHPISSGGSHGHGQKSEADVNRGSGGLGTAGGGHTHPPAGGHDHGGNTGQSGSGAIPAFGVNWLVKL